MKIVVIQLELLEEPELRIHLFKELMQVDSERLVGDNVYEVSGRDNNGNTVTQLVNKLDNQATCIFTHGFKNVICVVTAHGLCESELPLIENALMSLNETLNNQCSQGNEPVFKLREALEQVMQHVICGEVM